MGVIQDFNLVYLRIKKSTGEAAHNTDLQILSRLQLHSADMKGKSMGRNPCTTSRCLLPSCTAVSIVFDLYRLHADGELVSIPIMKVATSKFTNLTRSDWKVSRVSSVWYAYACAARMCSTQHQMLTTVFVCVSTQIEQNYYTVDIGTPKDVLQRLTDKALAHIK